MIFWKHWHSQINHGYASTMSKRHVLEEHKRVKDWNGLLSETRGLSQPTFSSRKAARWLLRKDLRQTGCSLQLHPNTFPCALALRWGRWEWALMVSSSSQMSPVQLVLCLPCNTQRARAQKQMSGIKPLCAGSLLSVCSLHRRSWFQSRNANDKLYHSCWEHDGLQTTPQSNT